MVFKQVHLLFGLETSDVQVKFISLFRFLSLFPIGILENISFFSFFPGSLYIVELELKLLQTQSGSGATTIIYNKILFSVLCIYVPISLTGKFEFVLFPFYPNQYIFLGKPNLKGILVNPVDISLLLEDGFY